MVTKIVARQRRLLSVTVALAGAAVVLTGCGEASGPGDPAETIRTTGLDPRSATGPTGAEVEVTETIPVPCEEPGGPGPEGLQLRAGGVEGAAADTGQELLDLAAACDLDGLVALATEDGTRLSLGGTSPGDAFAEHDGAERARAMAALLSSFEPSTAEDTDGGSFVRWPAEDVLDDEAASARLVDSGVHTEDELAMMRDFGGYTGWRVVVDGQGTWVFMGAGD